MRSDTVVENQQTLEAVDGLNRLTDFISVEEEQKLIEKVDTAEWSSELARRVQHYGYKYDYKARRIDASMNIGPLPSWLQVLAQRLVAQGIFSQPPDQVIVNEYLPGHGIAPHIDCEPCFGDTIASLSLQAGCVMDFTQVANATKISLWLPPRSLVILHSAARYEWKHSIAKRQQDQVDGQIVPRSRRISLTFRNVKRTI